MTWALTVARLGLCFRLALLWLWPDFGFCLVFGLAWALDFLVFGLVCLGLSFGLVWALAWLRIVVNMHLTFCLNSKFNPVRVLLDELPRNF